MNKDAPTVPMRILYVEEGRSKLIDTRMLSQSWYIIMIK